MLPGDWNCQWGNNSADKTFDIFFGSDCIQKEKHMFMNACWSDVAIGGVCLLIAFFLMFISGSGYKKNNQKSQNKKSISLRT